MSRIWLASLAVAAVAFVVLSAGRGYPWQLALLTAVAIGALVYSTWRTVQNMRRLRVPPGAAGEPPGDDRWRRD